MLTISMSRKFRSGLAHGLWWVFNQDVGWGLRSSEGVTSIGRPTPKLAYTLAVVGWSPQLLPLWAFPQGA